MRSKEYGTGESKKTILLVAPRHPRNFWTLDGALEILGGKALIPNLALQTLMALTPPDADVRYLMCDENVTALDGGVACDLVAITGSTLHAGRIRELCERFAARSIPIALGGTYASIRPDLCAPLCQHLFVGEAERTWPRFLREWLAGEAAPRYEEPERVDLAESPRPDWSLVDPADYVNLAVQTTRGCPHQCDFCDVIQVVGRKVRTKPIPHVMAELEEAHARGSRAVFIADDNLLASRPYTRELLAAIVEWNTAKEEPVLFTAQISMDVADDEELLQAFADARFLSFFLGLESIRDNCLEEVGKHHNVRQDPARRVRRISRYGIIPFLGMIVGFDHDDEQTFEELAAFIEETRTPTVAVSLLNAPFGTPLHERLQAEGRLIEDDFHGEWQLHTNIVPKQMSRETLIGSYRRLMRELYEPARFGRRLRDWFTLVEYQSPHRAMAPDDLDLMVRIFSLLRATLGDVEADARRAFFKSVKQTIREQPHPVSAFTMLLAQFRHFHGFVQSL
ncbi:MAG: DUF4070 domain-containing protein [bacterium]